MSGSVTSLASAADTAAHSAYLSTTSATSSSTASSSSSNSSSDALNSLTSNFNAFLQLLMTQLQNQDPTSPMDSSQFTTELVQFAGVQQQVNTNTNLTNLIQATQGEESLQGSAMVGKTVNVSSTTTLPLQNGSAGLTYTAGSASQPVEIAVYDANGNEVLTTQTVSSQAGSNSWTWNGTNDAGQKVADGAYTVAVIGQTGASTASLPFTVQGTVTGVTTTNNTVNVQLGSMTAPLSTVQQVQAGS